MFGSVCGSRPCPSPPVSIRTLTLIPLMCLTCVQSSPGVGQPSFPAIPQVSSLLLRSGFLGCVLGCVGGIIVTWFPVCCSRFFCFDLIFANTLSELPTDHSTSGSCFVIQTLQVRKGQLQIY